MSAARSGSSFEFAKPDSIMGMSAAAAFKRERQTSGELGWIFMAIF